MSHDVAEGKEAFRDRMKELNDSLAPFEQRQHELKKTSPPPPPQARRSAQGPPPARDACDRQTKRRPIGRFKSLGSEQDDLGAQERPRGAQANRESLLHEEPEYRHRALGPDGRGHSIERQLANARRRDRPRRHAWSQGTAAHQQDPLGGPATAYERIRWVENPNPGKRPGRSTISQIQHTSGTTTSPEWSST